MSAFLICSCCFHFLLRTISSLLWCRYQGVCLCRTGNSGRWQAQVTFKRKRHYLGMHRSEVDAAKAYDEGAICLLVRA